MTLTTSRLVGTAEVAGMLDVTRQRVAQLIASHPDFPAPIAEISAGRIWSRVEVEAWATIHASRRAGRPSSRSIRFERLSETGRLVLARALVEAQGQSHAYIGCEHLLLALTKHDDLLRLFRAFGTTAAKVRRSIIETIGPGTSSVATGSMEWTRRAQEALAMAEEECFALGHRAVDATHILLGIVHQGENIAAHVLLERGLNLERLRKAAEEVVWQLKAEEGEVALASKDLTRQLARIEDLLESIEARIVRLEKR